MSAENRVVDFEAALINPADHFAEPGAVVVDPSLSRVQKLKILQQWELDARQLAVAEEENMIGGEENMIGRVSKALLALGGRRDPVAEGITKLG
jgi:hypothetical protein